MLDELEARDQEVAEDIAAQLQSYEPSQEALIACGLATVGDASSPDADQLVIEAFEEAEPIPETAIPIPEEPEPRVIKAGKGSRRKKPALITLPESLIAPEGECLGGRYYWVTDLERALSLLYLWTERRLWAAVDLETGAAWREKPDPETGKPERYYPDGVIDPFVSPIFLMSVSVEPGIAVVFDWRRLIQHEEFVDTVKRFLTTCGIVAHNSFFEQIFFLTHLGVLANVVYDTAIVSQICSAGLPSQSDLESVMARTLGLQMEKEWQKQFLKLDPESPLCDEAIRYSAGDVCQLLAAMRVLNQDLKEKNLTHIWKEIERPLLRWMAIAKVEGLVVDMQVLEEIRSSVTERLEEERAKFAELATDVLITSPVQLKKWFNANGWKIAGTDEKVLIPLLARDPDSDCGRAARILLNFREMHKLLTTYIQPMMEEHPSPVTGRIHPDWKQCGASDTGRMSCASPNLQNVPARTELGARIRTAVVARTGHALVYCDYSQFEVRALADQANEQQMIRVYNEAYQLRQELEARLRELGLPKNWPDLREKDKEGTALIYEQHPEIQKFCLQLDDCDFHKRTAAALFKKDVREVTKAERTAAKTITFALPYGASARGIAEQSGLTQDEAEKLLEKYYLQFPNVDHFLKRMRMMAAQKGYTMSPLGRKRFYPRPDQRELYERYKTQQEEHKRVMAEFEAKLPTLTEKELKKLTLEEYAEKKRPKTAWTKSVAGCYGCEDPMEMAKRTVRRQMNGIERQGTNQPIQSCVCGDTRIFEQSRGYVPIKNLVGEPVSIWEGQQFANATVVQSGKKQLVRITLMGGHYIECSPDHRFLVRDTNGKEHWIEAGRLGGLSKSTRVVLTDAVPTWSVEQLLIPPLATGQPTSWNAKGTNLAQITDRRRLGEWLGRIASDGYVTDSTVTLLIAEHEKILLDALSGTTIELGYVGYQSHTKEGYTAPMHRLIVSSRSLARQLKDAGIKKRIPEFVWQDSILLAAYLRGLFDGDGTVNADGTVLTFGGGDRHLVWARQVQEALLLLGIRSRITVYPGEKGRVNVKVQKSDMPLFCERVGFLNPVKQEKAEAILGSNWKDTAAYSRAMSVKSVEITDEWVEMYDVVNSDTGRFMANGIVVHNCNADATKIATILAGPRLKALHPQCNIVGWVHDEILVTGPEELVQQMATILEESMLEAGCRVVKRCPIEVSTNIGKQWSK